MPNLIKKSWTVYIVQTISNQADIALGFWDIVPTKKMA